VPENVSIKAEPEWFGAKLATANLHPIAALSAENCTAQLGSCGPWYERLPHFRLEFTPSSGEELQSEYILPRKHALAAFHAVDDLRDQIAPLLLVSEIRTIAADTLWMSPCCEEDCVAIHFTWKQDWDAVQQVLPRIEAGLAPFEARPHWGKLFTMQPAHLQSLYRKLPEFRQFLASYDPTGKFRNSFLDTYIF
jgi:xylitol oxidase